MTFLSASSSDSPGYTRRDLLGIDMVTIETEAALKQAQASGELERIGAVEMSDLQWLLRKYLPFRQVYSSKFKVWSLPMRPMSDPSYAPCLAFVRDAHDWPSTEGRDFSASAARLVDIMERDDDGKKKHDDEEEDALQQACAGIMWAFYDAAHGGKLPDDIVRAAASQLTTPADLFLRPTLVCHARDIGQVFDYTNVFRNAHADMAALPDDMTADLAHTIFIMTLNAARLCRELKAHPNKDPDMLYRDLGLSETAIRICKIGGTLGGLLKESQHTTALRTVVTINLADIARESGDPAYAFQVDADRACPAKYQLLALARAVQEEVRKRLEVRRG